MGFMYTVVLPLVWVALGVSAPAPEHRTEEPVVVTAPRTAQVRLAVTLGEAEAIHAVVVRRGAIVFAIDRAGQAFEVVATTQRGQVTKLSIRDRGPALGGGGGLTWLAAELAEATAVTGLAVDEDGAVTITTSDGRAYLAIPGRGSGGNAGVEAQWAAAWDRDDA